MVKIWLTLVRRLGRQSDFTCLADDAKSTPSLVYFLQIGSYMRRATEAVLYEAAVHALASTVSGASRWDEAPARSKYKTRATPMEAPLAADVGHACANMKLTREAANELLLQILNKYEDQIADAPLGSEFRECYDAARSIPTPEYLDLYARVRRDLADMGLEFPYRSHSKPDKREHLPGPAG